VFIPQGQDATAVLESITNANPVVELEGEETPDNDTRLSEATASPFTPADVRAELSAELGDGGVQNLLDSGSVRLLGSQEHAKRIIERMKKRDVKHSIRYSKNGIIQGFTAGKKVYLVQDGIAGSKAFGVLKHELGVHLRQLLHGDKAFGDLQKSVEDRQNEQSVTGEAIRAAMKRVPKDTNPEHYWEEVLAYMVEQAPQVGIVRRLLALVKRALVKLGLDPKIFTVDDIAAMADVAVRSVGDGGDVNPRFSFAGVNAIGADKFTLAVAQVMETDGAGTEDIWRKTGWWKLGNDWKFEIDDSLSSIRSTENGLLEDILDHPQLFNSYPQLGKIRVRFMDMGDNRRGSYDSDKRIIKVNERLSPEGKRSALQHEVQHIIQETEGFPGGGNMMALGPKAYAAQTGEVESRLVQRRLNMPPAVRKRTPPWVTLDKMLREEGLLELGQRAEDVLTTSTVKFSEKAEENFDLKESAGKFYEKIHDKPDIPFLARIFSTPEYYFKSFPATWKMFNAQLDRHKEKFNLENDMLGDFVPVFTKAQKENKAAYNQVQEYLLETDRTGKSYRLKHEQKWEVKDDEGNIVGYTNLKRDGESWPVKMRKSAASTSRTTSRRRSISGP